jgi:hypothetical protein
MVRETSAGIIRSIPGNRVAMVSIRVILKVIQKLQREWKKFHQKLVWTVCHQQ